MSGVQQVDMAVARLQPGINLAEDGRSLVRLWAPDATTVTLEVSEPTPGTLALDRDESGFWSGDFDSLRPGTRYKFRIDDAHSLPDPASKSQPEGVHGPSEVIASEFDWSDQGWHGLPAEEYILYELHVGTFTEAGTFDAAIQEFPRLKELGINAVEVMPVSQFPGTRNWGYDGVYLYSVQNSYGGAAAFRRFVDAAHGMGIAVVLDVVYNHLGPEGNYLGQFGPYFTDRHHTPWGSAVNFDGSDSAPVREFFIENALYWVRDFHVDGLRLDAVHAMFDNSTPHILSEIADAVHSFGRRHQRTIAVIAESDLNEALIVRSGELGGYGLDAQWSDDFHHSLHSVLTGETSGYYEDFGRVQDVAAALSGGFVYAGQHSRHRGRCHGTDCTDVPGRAFVVCIQNHDQIGNRMLGERLSHLVALDDLKLAAGILLLSPFVPLLFMGQEYAETAQFLYFVSHTDPGLVEAVRQGRKREFAAFAWRGDVPDPQAEETFLRSKLRPQLGNTGWHAVVRRWYTALIHIRRTNPALATLNRQATSVDVVGSGHTIALRRWSQDEEVIGIFHLGVVAETVDLHVAQRSWEKLLDSAEPEWKGQGSSVAGQFVAGSHHIKLLLGPKQCLVIRSNSALQL